MRGISPGLIHDLLLHQSPARQVVYAARTAQPQLYSLPCRMSNVPTHAPEPAEIASDLRYIVGQLARRTRERDVVTLSTRLAETLSFLDREGPMTTSELAERHSVRQQSMAAKLAELDADGYLERQPPPTDRRKILIAISQDGRD